MKTIAFFNNKGGVGKTTLLYHTAWMFSEMGLRTVAVDLDPQSNLTSMFLDEARLYELWGGDGPRQTIVASVAPLLEEGNADVQPPHCERITKRLYLVPGDLGLANMEDELSAYWSKCIDGASKAFRITTVFHTVIRLAANATRADVVLLDVGPNLGALNRCGMIAAEHIVVPLVPDLFSLQGLHNLGPTLQKWRKGWQRRLEDAPRALLDLPKGLMQPAGYVVLQHAVRRNRPVKAYQRWALKIPDAYRLAMSIPENPDADLFADDPNCLAQLKHYRSLMPLAMEAGKPMFHLTPADGAIGSHVDAVNACRSDFHAFAVRLAEAVGLDLPGTE